MSNSTDIEKLHTEIRKCTLCVDAGFPISPPPIATGVAPAPFMIIGQAPSLTDMRVGETYSGPAGLKLRGWMREAGFADEDFGRLIYPAALTKCFPGRPLGKSTDRPPSTRERELCRPWLDRQIAVVDPKALILFGKMAIDTFLGAGSMTERIGHAFEWRGRTAIPLPHSSGASIWLNDPANRMLLADAIALIARERLKITLPPSGRAGG